MKNESNKGQIILLEKQKNIIEINSENLNEETRY